MSDFRFNRRDVVRAGLALGLAPTWGHALGKIHTKPIPATGEALPIIGYGTYRTFDVFGWPWEISLRRDIIDKMDLMQAGGVIDLMQGHNLRDTDVHMGTIREWQQDGRIRYNGITHWESTALPDFEQEMIRYEPQFIQINYNLGEREVEERILPLAADMGIAVMINRPYMHGRLFKSVAGMALPDWATAFADSWGQFFLKFIVSHPSVTCVIPATSDMEHLEDNLGAGTGPMPDAATRQRMVSFFESL